MKNRLLANSIYRNIVTLVQETIALQCPKIYLVTSNQNKNNAMLPAGGNQRRESLDHEKYLLNLI